MKKTTIQQDGPTGVFKTYVHGAMLMQKAAYEYAVAEALHARRETQAYCVAVSKGPHEFHPTGFRQAYAGLTEEYILRNLHVIFPGDKAGAGAIFRIALSKVEVFIALALIDAFLPDAHEGNFAYALSNGVMPGKLELTEVRIFDLLYSLVPGVPLTIPLTDINVSDDKPIRYLSPEGKQLIRAGLDLGMLEIGEKPGNYDHYDKWHLFTDRNCAIKHPTLPAGQAALSHQYLFGAWWEKVLHEPGYNGKVLSQECTKDIEKFIERLMQPRPEDRYASWGEVKECIESIMDKHAIQHVVRSEGVCEALLWTCFQENAGSYVAMKPDAQEIKRFVTPDPARRASASVDRGGAVKWHLRRPKNIRRTAVAGGLLLVALVLHQGGHDPEVIFGRAEATQFDEKLARFFDVQATDNENLDVVAVELKVDAKKHAWRDLRLQMAINRLVQPLQGGNGVLYRYLSKQNLSVEESAMLDAVRSRLIALSKSGVQNEVLEAWKKTLTSGRGDG